MGHATEQAEPFGSHLYKISEECGTSTAFDCLFRRAVAMLPASDGVNEEGVAMSERR